MKPFGTLRNAGDGVIHTAEKGDKVKEKVIKKQKQEYIEICLNCTEAVCRGCAGRFEFKAQRRKKDENSA